ncbi:MAG: hypothetical protein II921_03755 [Treponema sp.]|nr:hypothetical protein [Treponema sp.]
MSKETQPTAARRLPARGLPFLCGFAPSGQLFFGFGLVALSGRAACRGFVLWSNEFLAWNVLLSWAESNQAARNGGMTLSYLFITNPK